MINWRKINSPRTTPNSTENTVSAFANAEALKINILLSYLIFVFNKE